MRRVEAYRIGQCCRYQRALSGRELGCCGLEFVLGGGLCTVDAFPHLDGVEVDLHYPLLGPEELYQYGEVNFQPLAYP